LNGENRVAKQPRWKEDNQKRNGTQTREACSSQLEPAQNPRRAVPCDDLLRRSRCDFVTGPGRYFLFM